MEKIATAKAFYFDKTGTVTSGNPNVVNVIKMADYNEKQIVHLAANVEYGSRHPLAKSILNEARKLNCVITPAKGILVENGKGVSGKVDDKVVWGIDGIKPDRFDLIGGCISLAGVSVIMYWPRG